MILRIRGVYDEDGHTVPIAQQIARIYERCFESSQYSAREKHGLQILDRARFDAL